MSAIRRITLHFRVLAWASILVLLAYHEQSLCFAQPNEAKNEIRVNIKYQPINEWHNDVIYALFVDRFFDGDPNNNKEANPADLTKFQGGDLAGVIQKLDYIKDLGATTLLLNPVTESSTYHGYHVTDHFQINHNFGDLSTYRQLIQEAHARGLKVLFDFVANQVGKGSPLVTSHPDWFHPAKGYAAVNELQIEPFRSQASFWDLPDWNQDNPEAYRYLLKYAKFWIDQGVDGFRMDAVTQIPPSFFKKFNRDIKKYAGQNFFILGEIFSSYVDQLNEYAPYFDSIFDFRVHSAVATVFDLGTPAANDIYYSLFEDSLYYNKKLLFTTFIDSHDAHRFLSYCRRPSDVSAVSYLEQALIYLFTIRGIPYILYGTEIGLLDAPELAKTDFDASRTPMKFDRNEDSEIYKFLRKLIEVRKHYHLSTAKRFEIWRTADVQAYGLTNSDHETILVFHNFGGPISQKFTLNGLLKNTPVSAELKDALSGQTVRVEQGVFGLSLGKGESKLLILGVR